MDSNKVRPVGGDNFTGYRNESGMTDATSMSFFDGFMILKSVMDGSIARWLVV